MSLEPILIAGEWRQARNPRGSFSAVNPTTKQKLQESFPVSDVGDVQDALVASHEAVSALRGQGPERIACFLDLYAAGIVERAEDLIARAHVETAYPEEPRLRVVEIPRTTDQLRQAAAAALDRSWTHPTIDTTSNIRSMFGPLGGAVVVFGPNNFPFAFNSVAGGDFAAAIAAGNPVIAKANTGHPGTTKLLAEIAVEAVRSSGLPESMVQMIYRTPPEVGLELVSDPLVGATGFTGSRSAGLRLKEAADKVGKPIYLEMSSVNPVFILPGVLSERPKELADELYASCSLGAGQFCTNPGLTVVAEGDLGENFIEYAQELFEGNSAGTLLGAGGPSGIIEGIRVLQEHGAEIVTGGKELDEPRYAFANTLLRVTGDAFLQNPGALQTEAFGTVNLVVVCRDVSQMAAIASSLEGNLTGCIYSHSGGEDDEAYDGLAAILREKVGRLLNDKMPTGVAVVPSMNHGGPFPATGHPGFTAVGIPTSLSRFAALHSYDEVRPYRLPSELQDVNPTGEIWRSVNGEWTKADALT
jgi:alpha-ketoglutaric semialdehyde dehydrogenase